MRHLRSLLVAAFVCLLAGSAFAQESDRFTLVFRGAPLDRALEDLARLTKIDLIYSSALVDGKTVYCDGRDAGSEALLRCILKNSGLDYVRTSAGTYVLLDARRRAALYGDLAGRIIDATTGEPLPAANVLLADASVGTTTNDAGLFHFASLMSGMHRVMVSYVGYETAVDSIRIDGGESQRMQIALQPHTFDLEPVIIDGLVHRLPSLGLGSGEVEPADLRHTSSFGTTDAARAAAAIAGVSTRHPLADLHIQGGGPGEHLTLLDGVPVRDPVTLGRHLSAFSPLAVKRVTIHKAGFGAPHGGHVTGVVRLDHDVTAHGSAAASLLVDPVSVSGKVQGRLVDSDDTKVDGMVSYRNSLWNVYRDPGLASLLDRWNTVDPMLAGLWISEPVTSIVARRHRPDVAFSDLHGAAKASLGDFRTVDASVYRASNQLGSELVAVNADPSEEPDRMLLTLDEYDWLNWAGQARYSWLVDARTAASVQARASSNWSEYHYMSAQDDVPADLPPEEIDLRADELRQNVYAYGGSGEENFIRELAVEAFVSRSVSSRAELDLAVDAAHIESRFQLANQFVAPFTHDADAWQLSAYADGRWSLGIRTLLEPGIRLTYLPDRQSVYAEPRLSVRYDREGSAVGPYAVRLAGGLYRQFVPSFSLTSSGSTSVVPFVRFWLPLDGTLSPPQSYHLSAEALVMPSPKWSLGVEAYRKWQPRELLVDYVALLDRNSPAALRQSDFVTSASGRVMGASVKASYSASSGSASIQYAYTLAERRYPNRFGGSLEPAPWNEPHRLSGSATINISDPLAVYVQAEASWGRTWAFRRAYYDYLALTEPSEFASPYSFDDPSQAELPAYQQLDVGVSYTLNVSALDLQIRAALINVLDRENVHDWSLQPDASGVERIARTLPGRRPSIAVRLAY